MAFAYVPQGKWLTPYGYTYPQRDKNEMCPYCKNEDTDVVRDPAYLSPFADFYGKKVQRFSVVHCRCCLAVWHFYVTNGEQNDI